MVKLSMISPRTVLRPAARMRPLAPGPARNPLSSMSGAPANPGCVEPSIRTGTVMGENLVQYLAGRGKQ